MAAVSNNCIQPTTNASMFRRYHLKERIAKLSAGERLSLYFNVYRQYILVRGVGVVFGSFAVFLHEGRFCMIVSHFKIRISNLLAYMYIVVFG